MATVVPYKIEVPEDKIQKLKDRLADPEFPDELQGASWSDESDGSGYPTDDGVPLAEIKRLAAFWRDRFDWRKLESKLNALPTFMASLPTDDFDTLEVYFIHVQSMSRSEKAIPLLFLHGWPGSVLEVTKLIPLLAELEQNGGPAFNIVAPSYPNFGWSSAIKKPGFRLEQYADTCHQLMATLGYEQYVIQAGDMGVPVSKVIGMRHQQNLRAIHWNLVPGEPPSAASPVSFVRFLITHIFKLYSPREAKGLERTMGCQEHGWGYHVLQRTKPQTLAYALTDSPVGLLAWIYEKLHDWSDNYPWTDEEICDWVSMHWLSRNGPGPALRMYKETWKGDYPVVIPPHLSHVKLGLAYFPKSVVILPKAWTSSLGQVVYMNEHDEGGHFSAWEVPHAIVHDLASMLSKEGPAYGVVNGCSGYE